MTKEMTKLTDAQKAQIMRYLEACRDTQKSTTVEGVCYHLDLPTSIYDLRAVRAHLRQLRAEGKARYASQGRRTNRRAVGGGAYHQVRWEAC